MFMIDKEPFKMHKNLTRQGIHELANSSINQKINLVNSQIQKKIKL